jgi:putative transposase
VESQERCCIIDILIYSKTMEIYKGAQTRYQIGYHMVWGVKYHKFIINNEMKSYLNITIKQICEAYDFHFICLGLAPNHVHLFAGAPPKIAPAKIVQTIKSITAREIFKTYPAVKKELWGGEFWKNGYYIGTVGEGQTEEIVKAYIKNQGHHTNQEMKQLKLFY